MENVKLEDIEILLKMYLENREILASGDHTCFIDILQLVTYDLQISEWGYVTRFNSIPEPAIRADELRITIHGLVKLTIVHKDGRLNPYIFNYTNRPLSHIVMYKVIRVIEILKEYGLKHVTKVGVF